MMRSAGTLVIVATIVCTVSTIPAQQPATVPPITPPAVAFSSEQQSAEIVRFSFIAYGDTRGQVDGAELQPDHAAVIDAMVKALPAQQAAGFPVRFVVQSGDAVTSGGVVQQWNQRFIPLIERLTVEQGLHYFFAVGNHDLGAGAVGSPDRELRLRNVNAAMARLWPAEGSSRRLAGYPTFSFGFGRYFFIALDSNIAGDQVQLAWVTRHLEELDRKRFPHLIVFFHHPPLTSGPHGGPTSIEAPTAALRNLYLPLFRKHHVRMTISGHDHLHDHWVEHYEDDTGTHRMDHVVTGGGGAPTYIYRGEPDVRQYTTSALPQQVRLEHLAAPGPTIADNPHHFLIFDVDGDRLWVQAIGTGPTPFLPYGRERIELADSN